MIRPDKLPTDDIPMDLDPRSTPEQRLRGGRRDAKRELALGAAAVILGGLGAGRATGSASKQKRADDDPSQPGRED